MRKRRLLRDGGRYHVVARANRKEMILETDAMKDLFLEVVARAKKKYDFRTENFCIMGNHFHIIVQPMNESNLSEIMRWIMSVFAMAWNRIHHVTGHVWGGRFFSRLISSLMEYIQVFKYIDDNPVKACQVVNAEGWKYGGLWHFRRGLRNIVDELPDWMGMVLPGHRVLVLG